jgi:hypothetical protein
MKFEDKRKRGNIMVKKMIASGLIYFIIIIVIGLILRIKLVTPILPGFQYMHLVHAHSHVAFLGWVYFLLLAILIKYCIPENEHNSPSVRVVYYGTHFSVIGMLISFSLQGYAFFSIMFSTFHIFFSYYFAYIYFTRRHKNLPIMVSLFFHTGVIIMLLSSIGPWALAFVGAKGLSNTPIFNSLIYFYLHLQYNGWFTFMIMGTAYQLINRPYSLKVARWQYGMLLISVIPTFIPDIIDLGIPVFFQKVGMLGAVLQLISTALFLVTVWTPLVFKSKGKSAKWLLHVAFVSLAIKSLMEFLQSWPFLGEMIPSNRQVVLGYLHLTLLGFVSSFLLYFLRMDSGARVTSFWRRAVFLFCIGTASMIGLLFLAGLFIWMNIPLHLWIWVSLFVASAAAGVGTFAMLPGLMSLNSRTNHSKRGKTS